MSWLPKHRRTVCSYNLILSNTGFDNLLYADSSFNITQEIIDGLNARYTSAAKK